MLSDEVKYIIRKVAAKQCSDLGFRRTKSGGLGWYRPVDDHYFVIAFRTPRQWNRHWGGFLECKLRIQDQINPWIAERRKPFECSITSLASDADRELLRRWYNEAAAMTSIPNEAADHLSNRERKLCELLRVALQGPLPAEYNSENLLRFRNEEDVRRLGEFILERLVEWMDKVVDQWRIWFAANGSDCESHQPFLDAIQANPDSDAPRLAYADWLEQRGDAWSEVIRTQCRYPDGFMPFKTAFELEHILNAHRHRFDRGADDLSVDCRFHRGMVEEIRCSAATFVRVADRILETFPLVNVLQMHKIQGRGAKLAYRPELSAMRSLHLYDLYDDDWPQIVESEYLNRVVNLRVAFARPIDLAWLLDKPLARQLQMLDLTASKLDANLLSVLGETDAVSGVRALILENIGMDDEMAERLSQVETLRHLRQLSVANNRQLGIEGIAFLLEAEFIPRLAELVIGLDTWHHDRLVRQLVESKLSSTLKLSIRSVCTISEQESLRKRFPNCSFGSDFAKYF